MFRRIDHLAALGALSVHLSGGEPLLHPDVDAIIGRIRERGMSAGLLTNGYLLSIERIRRLNRAGLDILQISIDNVTPDEVSMKSLKVLDQKLQWLAQYAEFDVNINSVVGSGLARPEEALAVAEKARALGLKSTVGIIHDGNGQLRPLDERQRDVYDRISGHTKNSVSAFVHRFQENLVRGLPNDWRCHAGGRYLYICEDGLVHYCSQQRGSPGTPLLEFSVEDVQREYHTQKSCAPFCTVSCVHRIAVVDEFREDPRGALSRFFPGRMPVSVRILKTLFLPKASGRPTAFSRMTLKLLRLK
jgi:MoaA/NifB/PqqE/SkfB family radical SAM enzyme